MLPRDNLDTIKKERFYNPKKCLTQSRKERKGKALKTMNYLAASYEVSTACNLC
jgi:hypothetical protein